MMTAYKLKILSILITAFCLDNCFAQTPASNQSIKSGTLIQLPNAGGQIDLMAFKSRNQN